MSVMKRLTVMMTYSLGLMAGGVLAQPQLAEPDTAPPLPAAVEQVTPLPAREKLPENPDSVQIE